MKDPAREAPVALTTVLVQCRDRKATLSCLSAVTAAYHYDWLAKCLPLHSIAEGLIHGSPGKPNSTNGNLEGGMCVCVC